MPSTDAQKHSKIPPSLFLSSSSSPPWHAMLHRKCRQFFSMNLSCTFPFSVNQTRSGYSSLLRLILTNAHTVEFCEVLGDSHSSVWHGSTQVRQTAFQDPSPGLDFHLHFGNAAVVSWSGFHLCCGNAQSLPGLHGDDSLDAILSRTGSSTVSAFSMSRKLRPE